MLCCAKRGMFLKSMFVSRYGEHVLEALENPDWTCPVCRGICNCSLCRKRKGWLPTGNAYKKVNNFGALFSLSLSMLPVLIF